MLRTNPLRVLPPPEEPTDKIARIYADVEWILGSAERLRALREPPPPPKLTVIRGEGEDDDA